MEFSCRGAPRANNQWRPATDGWQGSHCLRIIDNEDYFNFEVRIIFFLLHPLNKKCQYGLSTEIFKVFYNFFSTIILGLILGKIAYKEKNSSRKITRLQACFQAII